VRAEPDVSDLDCNTELQIQTGDGIFPEDGKGVCTVGDYPYQICVKPEVIKLSSQGTISYVKRKLS
jgi:hypothetical protein